ncbi:MAG: alpha/beta hydrolase [Ginsengibacter sp.]
MRLISFALFMLLLSGLVNAQKVIPLYNGTVPNDTVCAAPVMIAFLPAKEINTGVSIIIFPGGGYTWLDYNLEGIKVAQKLITKGIAAFVVKYRLPAGSGAKDKSIVPLQDAQQSIKLVRMNAKLWNLDTSKVGIMGASAGGHVASSLGTHFATNYIFNPDNINLRPDFTILLYPVISMKEELTHKGSRKSLLGENPLPEKVWLFSNEEQVTPQTPPCYITHAGDDSVVSVYNSIHFYEALQKNGVSAELHLFAKGDHGFVFDLPFEEWMNPILLWMKKGKWLATVNYFTKKPALR